MGADVIGVRISPRLVVGDKHLRPELADDLHERLSGSLEGNDGKGICGHRLVVFGQTGILVAQPAVLEADGRLGVRHLDTPQASHIAVRHRLRLERFVLNITALATGATDHEHLGTDAAVVGVGCGTLTRLVIGMGVHGKQALCHRTPWG